MGNDDRIQPRDGKGGQNPYGLGDYNITLSSTEILRKFLLGKNLQSSYLADSNPVPPSFGIQSPGKNVYTNLSDNFIIDQKMDFLEGNIIKYICRHRNKNKREDLEKAKQYIDMIILRDYE